MLFSATRTSAVGCSVGTEQKRSLSHCRDLYAYFIDTVMEFSYSNPLSDPEDLALYGCTHEHANLFTLYFTFLFRKVNNLLLVLSDVASLIKLILCKCGPLPLMITYSTTEV